MYQILFVHSRWGWCSMAATSKVLSFKTRSEADIAFNRLPVGFITERGNPSGLESLAVKLYEPEKKKQ